MSFHRTRLRSCLVALMAVLVLLSGDGLHALTHIGGHAERAPAASGQLEAHAGDCQHRPHVPAHHDSSCQLCHHGAGAHLLAAPEAAVCCTTPCATTVWHASTWFAGAASVSGVLGARGPPVLSA